MNKQTNPHTQETLAKMLFSRLLWWIAESRHCGGLFLYVDVTSETPRWRSCAAGSPTASLSATTIRVHLRRGQRLR